MPAQEFSVDASTRRKGERMPEVQGDDRFRRRVLLAEDRRGDPLRDATRAAIPEVATRAAIPEVAAPGGREALCHLRLFQSAVLAVHIHARGCSTIAKFCQRSKKIQLLVCVDGTTRLLAVPFASADERPLQLKT